MANLKTYGSVAEALSELAPEDPEVTVEPSTIPVSTEPWPEGRDVAADIFRKLASQLRDAADRVG